MSRVELAGIAKRFGGVVALAGVDLAIAPGETHALLGENGAGKSTLIRVLTGAIVPDDGEIRVDGGVRRFAHPKDARAAGIAAVYQEPMIYPHLSVLENIFAGNEITLRGGMIRKAAMAERVRPWFARLDLSDDLLDRPMGRLSLGYQQLVLIAKALTQEARVIIFDEPTSILSQSETDRLFAIIRRLREDGRAIVYITHRLDEIGKIADRVTVLTDGRVTGAARADELDETKLLALMAGKASRNYGKPRPDRKPATETPPAFEIKGLCRGNLYRDVDWSVPAGRVTGVYGLVGSGRSEVALAAFGALPPDRGEIRLNGARIAPRDPAEAIARGIGYLPEDRKSQGIFATKPLEANLTASALFRFVHAASRLDFGGLRGEAARLIGRYRIKARDETIAIGTLSGGNQQKALFARWAGQSMKLLILDEPTRGIDIGTKDEIHDFIRELAASGLPVVVISSDLPEVLAVSDRVIVMRRGRVVTVAEGDAMHAEAILAAAVGTHARAA
ncbi:sugar ABC transporter ATP-binding protein [Acidiphilium sp. AL]|uniref:Sugar ABC transporter ATP-binding protein n=1 Tax=Acidiphilium iwatense TaxID=768198 RepID=A0ABS9DY74_9PROT|nr:MULTISPECIES: sugar ABC transporter ATP-binding protein [Acidiphilium]MCF3946274.1 sugar ABC transporter ATP-binding protein [Acidiphilium iwatense]MCU4158846.1 sugar ABC transporter ATP-binding protein [Acidiphilium sp. AL]